MNGPQTDSLSGRQLVWQRGILMRNIDEQKNMLWANINRIETHKSHYQGVEELGKSDMTLCQTFHFYPLVSH